MTEMRYTVVRGYNLPEFLAEVNGYLEKGWVPQGGIGVTGKNYSFAFYVQAMVYQTKGDEG